MDKELVKRLRDDPRSTQFASAAEVATYERNEAADRIEALEAENANIASAIREAVEAEREALLRHAKDGAEKLQAKADLNMNMLAAAEARAIKTFAQFIRSRSEKP